MARRSSIRASDADRDSVADRLRQAAAEGRILAHELEDRVARALRAQTYGELDALVSDLPMAPVKSRSRSRELARSHPLTATIIAATVAVAFVAAMAVAVLVVAWFMMAWGLWLLLGLAFMATRGGRRRHGYRPRYGVGPGRYPRPGRYGPPRHRPYS